MFFKRSPAVASITSTWIDDKALEALAARYRGWPLTDISYATVRDFVDSYEAIAPLTTAQGDLKDVQRPWTLKAVIGNTPPGGKVLEIGGGQPYVADLLARLGYEVWLVDPYDGSGNGPVEFETYRKASPKVRFVRALFDDKLDALQPGSLDCIYSISVLEHVPDDGLRGVFAGQRRFLKPGGVAIHAVDHVHKGNGADSHLAKLRFMVEGFGLSTAKLDDVLSAMDHDIETYYLSAESHNRWRGNMRYEDFPMRVCPSIQLFADARTLRDAQVTASA
ncbi:MAG: class I SAM-dependent methyltransferase [Lautropia sp.]